jgi:hypothetical protein
MRNPCDHSKRDCRRSIWSVILDGAMTAISSLASSSKGSGSGAPKSEISIIRDVPCVKFRFTPPFLGGEPLISAHSHSPEMIATLSKRDVA